MSSDSDRVIFDDALEPQDNTVLFQSKKWTNITDSSSSGGVFNGQLQFNLDTLSSQNQWTDLKNSYIQFPCKLTIKSSTTIGTAATQNFNNFSATIANGFHQFVDSVQITLNGTTIQSSQIFQNIATTFKILSEWDHNELVKNGASLGVAVDDYTVASDAAATTYDGMDNVALNTLSPANAGVVYPVSRNPGFKSRAQFLNSSVDTTATASAILGSNAATIGKGRVKGTSGSATLASGNDVFVAFYMATIRLKDISDCISKLPLIKGMKGYIYVNYNAAKISFNQDNNAVVAKIPASQALYGRTMPALLNFNANASAAADLVFTAEVSGIPSSTTGFTSIAPAFNNARLFAPYYVASPDVDRALTMTKSIRYLERYTTSFTIEANGQATGTLSPGITNPKRVILLPITIGTGTVDSIVSAGATSFSPNPLLSPWDIAGKGGSSPFAALSNLQLTVGGVPMWQAPITMDYESFCQELTKTGFNGGEVIQANSGLLSQRLWNQMYRYYTCDVSRRMGSEDGASKSITYFCNNATGSKLLVWADIWYEKEITVDTALGSVKQGM